MNTWMRTMAAAHGSVSRSHCGVLAEHGSDAAQKTPPSVRGYAWSTTPSMAADGGEAA